MPLSRPSSTSEHAGAALRAASTVGATTATSGLVGPCVVYTNQSPSNASARSRMRMPMRPTASRNPVMRRSTKLPITVTSSSWWSIQSRTALTIDTSPLATNSMPEREVDRVGGYFGTVPLVEHPGPSAFGGQSPRGLGPATEAALFSARHHPTSSCAQQLLGSVVPRGVRYQNVYLWWCDVRSIASVGLIAWLSPMSLRVPSMGQGPQHDGVFGHGRRVG